MKVILKILGICDKWFLDTLGRVHQEYDMNQNVLIDFLINFSEIILLPTGGNFCWYCGSIYFNSKANTIIFEYNIIYSDKGQTSKTLFLKTSAFNMILAIISSLATSQVFHQTFS